MPVIAQRRLLGSLALSLTVGLAAAGCSGGGSETAEDPTPSTSPTPSLAEGVELTEPGTELALGETATVLSQPRQTTSSALDLTVTKVTRSTIADFSSYVVDERLRAATPYYVEVSVENVGEADLGNTDIPLFVAASDDTLIEASNFLTPFEKCPSTPLPESFAAGASVDTCLAFLLAEGVEFESVAYAPALGDLVTWSGEISTPAPEPTKPPRKKKRG